MIDIVPDIHGQAEKLDGLLDYLGWWRTPAGWRGPEPDRSIFFLGDFIDRGAENARVINTVRSLIDAGKAGAVMGNHEFNAIQFHTVSEATGEPLRARSDKNQSQHAAFLNEFPVGAERTRNAIEWMKTLPIFHEGNGFRAVHACWYEPAIDTIAAKLPDARLTDEVLNSSNFVDSDTCTALDLATKGPEAPLPDGITFNDKDGTIRHHARLAWWRRDARTWAELGVTGSKDAVLPETVVSADARRFVYTDDVPVFFGHYWLTGEPCVEAPRALCLDYSAGADGPLVAYSFGGQPMNNSAGRIVKYPA